MSLRIMFLLEKKVVIVVLCRDVSTFISATVFRVCSGNGLFFSWNILEDKVFTYKKGGDSRLEQDMFPLSFLQQSLECSEMPKFNHEMPQEYF